MPKRPGHGNFVPKGEALQHAARVHRGSTTSVFQTGFTVLESWSGPQSKAHDAPVCLWPEPRESQALVPARERIVFCIDGDEHTAGALASVPCLSDCHHNKRLAEPASLIAPIHAKSPEQVAPDRKSVV